MEAENSADAVADMEQDFIRDALLTGKFNGTYTAGSPDDHEFHEFTDEDWTSSFRSGSTARSWGWST